MIYANNADTVGKTPLIRLNRVADGLGATVLVKVEARNPAFSVKDRIGKAMIEAAEADGRLKPGMTIIEPTSGNTGIALSFVAAAKGYGLVLTMPETMSLERRRVMAGLGADIVLTEGARGMKGAIERAQTMLHGDPDKYFMPMQFDNPANPAVHEATTGPEIWHDTEGGIDVFVSGVGTGGTITGVSRSIKHTFGKAIHSVAVEPVASPVITQTRAGEDIQPGPHKIQGIGAGFVPGNCDLSLVDDVLTVTDDEAIAMARRLMAEEGLLVGISSGGNVAAALRLASEERFAGKTIVTIACSAAERYLSTMLFDGIKAGRV
jgi:cysteine synthase A